MASIRVLVTVLACIYCISAFTWNTCAPEQKMHITELSVEPSPIEMPGKLKWKLAGVLYEDVPSTSMNIKLTKKKGLAGLFDFDIPCVKQVGSCHYKELCTIAQDMIAENWGFVGKYIGPQIIAHRKKVYAEQGRVYDENSRTCDPVKLGQVELSDEMDIPRLPKILSFLVAGDYKGRVELIDNSDNKMIICLEFEFSSIDKDDVVGK